MVTSPFTSRSSCKIAVRTNSPYIAHVIYDPSMDELLKKTWEGGRVSPKEALRLYVLPLETLGALAHRRRELAKANAFDGRGNEIITFSIDRNINYTNICNVYCKFCAFWRSERRTMPT